jgi:exosome complex component RRP42
MTGIKVEVGEPFPDTPKQGVLTVNAELVPLASPLFEPGPPSEHAIEIARVVDRGLRESKCMPLEKLCIQEGKKVMIVFVDVYILDHDGNLIDASAISALAALLTSKMTTYEIKGRELQVKDELVPLPIQSEPVAVTAAKVEGNMILDPCLDEEQVASARLTVTSDQNGNICAMQKGGLGALTDQEIRQAVKIAIQKGKEIRERIKEASHQ